jgi:hypothetical protein
MTRRSWSLDKTNPIEPDSSDQWQGTSPVQAELCEAKNPAFKRDTRATRHVSERHALPKYLKRTQFVGQATQPIG